MTQHRRKFYLFIYSNRGRGSQQISSEHRSNLLQRAAQKDNDAILLTIALRLTYMGPIVLTGPKH